MSTAIMMVVRSSAGRRCFSTRSIARRASPRPIPITLHHLQRGNFRQATHAGFPLATEAPVFLVNGGGRDIEGVGDNFEGRANSNCGVKVEVAERLLLLVQHEKVAIIAIRLLLGGSLLI